MLLCLVILLRGYSIINADDTQSIRIEATPNFQPPYSNDMLVTMENINPYECYMVLEFRASDGFKFLPISYTLPQSFIVEEGYEYNQKSNRICPIGLEKYTKRSSMNQDQTD